MAWRNRAGAGPNRDPRNSNNNYNNNGYNNNSYNNNGNPYYEDDVEDPADFEEELEEGGADFEDDRASFPYYQQPSWQGDSFDQLDDLEYFPGNEGEEEEEGGEQGFADSDYYRFQPNPHHRQQQQQQQQYHEAGNESGGAGFGAAPYSRTSRLPGRSSATQEYGMVSRSSTTSSSAASFSRRETSNMNAPSSSYGGGRALRQTYGDRFGQRAPPIMTSRSQPGNIGTANAASRNFLSTLASSSSSSSSSAASSSMAFPDRMARGRTMTTGMDGGGDQQQQRYFHHQEQQQHQYQPPHRSSSSSPSAAGNRRAVPYAPSQMSGMRANSPSHLVADRQGRPAVSSANDSWRGFENRTRTGTGLGGNDSYLIRFRSGGSEAPSMRASAGDEYPYDQEGVSQLGRRSSGVYRRAGGNRGIGVGGDGEEFSNGADRSKRVTLYKTEMCRSYAETSYCKYGDKCQFAHGEEELRNVVRHPRYKTEVCRTFHATSYCSYGTRCRFRHMDGLNCFWWPSAPLSYLLLHEDQGKALPPERQFPVDSYMAELPQADNGGNQQQQQQQQPDSAFDVRPVDLFREMRAWQGRRLNRIPYGEVESDRRRLSSESEASSHGSDVEFVDSGGPSVRQDFGHSERSYYVPSRGMRRESYDQFMANRRSTADDNDEKDSVEDYLFGATDMAEEFRTEDDYLRGQYRGLGGGLNFVRAAVLDDGASVIPHQDAATYASEDKSATTNLDDGSDQSSSSSYSMLDSELSEAIGAAANADSEPADELATTPQRQEEDNLRSGIWSLNIAELNQNGLGPHRNRASSKLMMPWEDD